MQSSLIFCLLSFVSCHYIDKGLTDMNTYYVNLLKENCGENYFHPNKILIRFSDLTSPNIGVCYRNKHDITIFIDEKTWLLSSNKIRYQLFMHEASHCYLNIDHSSDENHYMYYQLDGHLSKDTVYKQVVSDIKKSCNK